MKACDDTYDMSDSTEEEWMRAAASNPVFDFLKDPAQDIYRLEDGETIVVEER